MPATKDIKMPYTYGEFEEMTGQKPEAPEAQSPAVLDLNLLDKTQRTVQYLQHAGLIDADDHKTITALNVLKRINHAAYAGETTKGISQLQAEFQKALEAGDVTEGEKDSAVAKLVDGYLTAKVAHNQKILDELNALPSHLSPEEFNRAHHRATENVRKYEAERKYYEGSPELLNDAAREHPETLKDGYMSLGKLAVGAGFVDSDKAKARDMVDDTLAAAATHQLMHIAEEVMSTSDADLTLNQKFPERYASNITAKADDVAASTISIDRTSPAEEGTTPQLARIQALNSLLSAQLNAMTKHTAGHTGQTDPGLESLAQNLIEAKKLVNEYRSAAMSLASQFLADGPAKDDPRMRQQLENLNKMMDDNNIPRLMNPLDAEQAAKRLAEESAAYLISQNPGNAKAQANISTLLAQATAQATEQGMADKFAPKPVESFAEIAGRDAGVVASR